MKPAAARLFGLLAGLLLLAAACGGDDDSPTPWPTPTVTPETKLFIAVDGDLLEFSDFSTNVAVGYTAGWEGRFSVGDGTLVLFTFNNVSTVNQHNWVLVKNGAKDAVAARGFAALVLESLDAAYELDDPNLGLVKKAEFAEYLAGFKSQVEEMRRQSSPTLLEFSEIVTQQEGENLTAWAWLVIPGTPIQGAGLIKVGSNGVLSERLTFYTKLPEA